MTVAIDSEMGKLLFLALDFRLRTNQHYMALWVSLVFLLLSGKRDALRVLLVLFYVWASTLKFNADWLSGAALPNPLWLIPASWTPAACAYLIVLELLLSWGLLAARGWIFWSTLGQFLLFHLMSWAEVGFFFPSLMLLLLLIFPLARLIPPSRPAPAAAEPSRFKALRNLRLRPSTYGLLAGFSLLQLVPRLIRGDEALTGEGRLWALHMVDAPIECRATALVRRRDGSQVTVTLTGGTLLRIACDPIVVAERARNICRNTSSLVRDAEELDLRLLARRLSEPALRTVIDVPGFCARKLRYDPFGHNAWIQVRINAGRRRPAARRSRLKNLLDRPATSRAPPGARAAGFLSDSASSPLRTRRPEARPWKATGSSGGSSRNGAPSGATYVGLPCRCSNRCGSLHEFLHSISPKPQILAIRSTE